MAATTGAVSEANRARPLGARTLQFRWWLLGIKCCMDTPCFSLDLYYFGEPEDHCFLNIADPVPDLETALRLGWYFMGHRQADYALLYFELDGDLLSDSSDKPFEPKYRLTAPVTGLHLGKLEKI